MFIILVSTEDRLDTDCCELQKLYLDDSVKGRGLGYLLIEKVEQEARTLGYKRIYFAPLPQT